MSKIKCALISVWDKEGIVDFARGLNKLGIEIIATGGTTKKLKDAGIPAIPVSDIIDFPEILGGRVKSMHPVIQAGILALRNNKEHMEQLKKHNIKPIDMVVSNLYPFSEVIKKKTDLKEVLEFIDIGGPSMIRAAAKNFKHVVVVTNPDQYDRVLEELKKGGVSEKTRVELAIQAFKLTAEYDATIDEFLQKHVGIKAFPDVFSLKFKKTQDLRYGENPHQEGALYKEFTVKEPCVAIAKQLHGKKMSYLNYMDANAAFELVKEFKEPTVAVIKHTSPCGVGCGKTVLEAFEKAYASDPADGTEFVDPDVTLSWIPGMGAILHTVYLGDSFDEVNNATVGSPQTDATFTPGTLEFETTYYWRIDEFDGVTTHKGDLWSFTTKPFIAVTDPNFVCWWTLNEGSGTNVLDWSGHGHDGTVQGNAEWVLGYDGAALHFREGGSGYVVHPLGGASDWAAGTVALWVKADAVGQDVFSSAFSSHYPNTAGFQIDVDGGNPGLYRVNPSGLIFGPVTTAWVHLAMTFDGTSATLYYNGTEAESGTLNDTTFNQFALNINRNAANWMAGTLDDFRAYDKILTQDQIELLMRIDPLLAWSPSPANGSTPDIDAAMPLSWSAGDNASQHDVYFGTDEDVVDNADTSDATGIYRDRQSGTSYTPTEGIEWGGGPYYWRIDEVNTDGTITKGRIWRFTVADFILVDDFESYTDDDAAGEAIWQHWIDGFGVPGNGAQVGYLFPPYAEQTIVHSGNQSMPLIYDNTVGVTNSEAALTLTAPRDWTRHGLANLSLWFRGYPASTGSFTEGPAGIYTMTGSGADIWGTADQFHFAFKTLTGAGTIIARVDSVQNTHAWAKAGVMIRETLDAGSKHAFACVSPGNGVASQGRTGTDADSFSTNQTDIAAPHWVKLERDAGGNFAVSHSANGSSWESVGNAVPVNIPMTSNVYIGLALTSHDAAQTCEAIFSNVSTTGSVSGQWMHQDVGISSNAAEPMYVALSNVDGASAVVAHDDPAAATIDEWTEWVIPLQAFADQGVNLADVDKIAIGLGTSAGVAAPGGSGTAYFDDIRLYPPASEP